MSFAVSLKAASPETLGYTLVCYVLKAVIYHGAMVAQYSDWAVGWMTGCSISGAGKETILFSPPLPNRL
jgi:hypothetical protein